MSLLEDHEAEKDGGLAVTQLTAGQEEAIQEQEFKYATLLQVRNNLKDITS